MGISCASATFCAIADGPGKGVVIVDPLAPSFLTTHGVPDDVYGMWCIAAQLCVGAAESPKNISGLIGTTGATAKRPKWIFGPPGGVDDLACSQPGVCLAVDDEGDIDTGATVSGVASGLYQELLPPHLPSRQVLGPVRVPRLEVHQRTPRLGAGPLAHGADRGEPPTLLPSATDTLRKAGSAKVRLTLTPAGRARWPPGPGCGSPPAPTYATTDGAITRTKLYVFASPPKPRHHHSTGFSGGHSVPRGVGPSQR